MRRFITLREEPINCVWRAADERLRKLVQEPTYRDILKRFAVYAARELGTNELVLAADPNGHQLLTKETLEEWSREAGVEFRSAREPATAWGGLLAVSGRFRIDTTFPTRLALAQKMVRDRMFQILSEG